MLLHEIKSRLACKPVVPCLFAYRAPNNIQKRPVNPSPIFIKLVPSSFDYLALSLLVSRVRFADNIQVSVVSLPSFPSDNLQSQC